MSKTLVFAIKVVLRCTFKSLFQGLVKFSLVTVTMAGNCASRIFSQRSFVFQHFVASYHFLKCLFMYLFLLLVCFRKMNILLYGSNENVITLDDISCPVKSTLCWQSVKLSLSLRQSNLMCSLLLPPQKHFKPATAHTLWVLFCQEKKKKTAVTWPLSHSPTSYHIKHKKDRTSLTHLLSNCNKRGKISPPRWRSSCIKHFSDLYKPVFTVRSHQNFLAQRLDC